MRAVRLAALFSALMPMESNPVGMEQVLQSLEEMKTAMAALKRSFSEDREAAEERVAKRIRLDPPPTFKRKGHGKQFAFNSTLEDKLDVCRASLDETPPSIEKAKAALEEGCECVDMLSEVCGAEVVGEHAAIPSDSVKVQGRLRKSASFWRDTITLYLSNCCKIYNSKSWQEAGNSA